MAKRVYEPEVKAAVVAALLAGQSINSTAKEYNIPKSTIANWSAEINRDGIVPNTKKEEIGEKLIALVSAQIDTLIEISKTVRDPKWIKSQSAADLAVFVGVKQDKLMRMLEAFGRDDSDTSTTN